MPGRPRWPTSISTSRMSINKDFTTSFPPSLYNFLPDPIPVVTYSSGSILRMIEEHEDLTIAPWQNASKKCSSSMHKGPHTSSWMPSTSVQTYLLSHRREKRSSSLWMNLSAFTSRTSIYVLQVSLNL